jgi:uncharacterized protein (TIGR00251 family)
MSDKPFIVDRDGVRLAVRVTPRAKHNAVTGIVHDADGRPALAIRLAAPPVDGAANKALCTFIAELAGVSRSRVTIQSGETGRLKLLVLSGDVAAILGRLDAAMCG